MIFIWVCSNTWNKIDTIEISDTQRLREVCLDCSVYRVVTTKAIEALNFKTQKDSELMAYCEFFKNVADTKY